MSATADRTATAWQHLQDRKWHNLPSHKVAELLETNLERGLSTQEADRRREHFGLNQLTAKPGKPAWLRFLLQFHQPLLYILLIAGVIKAFLQAWVDAGVIFAVTFLNAVIGFVQESKAEGAILALAEVVTTEAIVIRDGEKQTISSTQLVPGDVVFLTSGDKVPADLRLVQSRNLQLAEAALTGESVPVEKLVEHLEAELPLAERRNMAFAGSFVTFGQGKGVVIATGGQTETGRISKLIDNATHLTTPLTRKFDRFSRLLLYIILGLAAFTFAVGLGQGGTWVEMFNAAVALAVSAIPEGLPAVVTITLAIGVSRMAQRHAIIRKLPAVETLGGTTVICSDKTGTLTENQMTVQKIYAGAEHYSVTGTGYSAEGEILAGQQAVDLAQLPTLRECLQAGFLCNDSHLQEQNGNRELVGDPTEGALLVSANKAGLTREALERAMPRLDTIPFESEFQYMATLHRSEQQGVIYVKGSTEALLDRCDRMLDASGQEAAIAPDVIHQQLDQMADQGLRVLAFAKKVVKPHQKSIDHDDIKTGLIFLGLQGMIDPPRQEAIAAVNACQSAGIQVKMITGDHARTASAIASTMGLQKDGRVVAFTGQDLERMDARQLSQAVEDGSVFARVAPEQKLRLVEALQSRGEVVAMTGDGVNDAPALKQSDVGIAMGITGTEVAKESADMILTDDNFASIEAAVEEGRTVYQNLLKAIAFLLPVNGGESMTILISVLLSRLLPIEPLQILWLNVVNSVTLTVPLAFEPKTEGTMHHPPRNPNQPLLSASLVRRIIAISLFNWVIIFGMFEWSLQQNPDNLPLARTMAINTLVAGRIIYLLSISQFLPLLWQRLKGEPNGAKDELPMALGLTAAIASQILLTHWGILNRLFGTAPLSLNQWLLCIAVGLPMFVLAIAINRFNPNDMLGIRSVTQTRV